MNRNEYPVNPDRSTGYDFGIALSLNNWHIESMKRVELGDLGPRWAVKIRFYNAHTTEQVYAKLSALKVDCVAQELTLDAAGVSDRQYEGRPIYANLVILEPGSKSAIVS